MEKRKPHCSLSLLKAMAAQGKVRSTFTALSGAAQLGFEFDDMLQVVQALTPSDLRSAACALDQVDLVLSPAEDGGYALIGARRVARALFDGVAWGSAQVLAQTRARVRRLGWRCKELRTVWDVDRPADVARLRRSRTLSPLVRGLGALSGIRKKGG